MKRARARAGLLGPIVSALLRANVPLSLYDCPRKGKEGGGTGDGGRGRGMYRLPKGAARALRGAAWPAYESNWR
jgi:hypothetical protein